jgi:hypothetical protein
MLFPTRFVVEFHTLQLGAGEQLLELLRRIVNGACCNQRAVLRLCTLLADDAVTATLCHQFGNVIITDVSQQSGLAEMAR